MRRIPLTSRPVGSTNHMHAPLQKTRIIAKSRLGALAVRAKTPQSRLITFARAPDHAQNGSGQIRRMPLVRDFRRNDERSETISRETACFLQVGLHMVGRMPRGFCQELKVGVLPQALLEADCVSCRNVKVRVPPQGHFIAERGRSRAAWRSEGAHDSSGVFA